MATKVTSDSSARASPRNLMGNVFASEGIERQAAGTADRTTGSSYLWRCHSWEVPESPHKTGWCSCGWGRSVFQPVWKPNARLCQMSRVWVSVPRLHGHFSFPSVYTDIRTRSTGCDVDKTSFRSTLSRLTLPKKAEMATRVTTRSRPTWQRCAEEVDSTFTFSKSLFLAAN